MWPIQIRIPNLNSKPKFVGIWKGCSKPHSADDFMRPFITDFLEVLNNGVKGPDGQVVSCEIRCFIADAPARAFLLSHVGHNGYFPCSECCVRGESLRPGVMVYRGIEHEPRTAEEYAARIDGDHHHDRISPLSVLPIDLVSQTPFEYMHLVCLGVMKKTLSVLVNGSYERKLKLHNNLLEVINARLLAISAYCPREFARKPEDISKFSSFKATELRQILLYTGPALFRGIIDHTVYLHFLILHYAVRLLINPDRSTQEITHAINLLAVYVSEAESIFGAAYLSYNVHCLLHLADDALKFGSLDMFSAFPYENNIMSFRSCFNKPHQHLQQIANRLAEDAFVSSFSGHQPSSSTYGPKTPWRSDLFRDLPAKYRQYKTIICRSWSLSVNNKDDTVILDDMSIAVVKNIVIIDEQMFIYVAKFLSKNHLYNDVIPNCPHTVFICSRLSSDIIRIPIDKIIGKCFRMPYWHNTCSSVPKYDSFVVALMASSIIS